MAIKINLLSQNYLVSPASQKISRLARKITIFSSVVLILLAVFVIGYISFLYITTSRINGEIEDLKTKVKNLQTAEQRILVIKDRIGKIKLLSGEDKISSKYDTVRSFLSTIPADATLNELSVGSDKTEVSIIVATSATLKQITDTLTQQPTFKNVSVSNLNYKPGVGYVVNFILN